MKIPLGNFGNDIADAPQRVNIPRAAFDTGNGLERFGDAVAGVGNLGLRIAAQEQAQTDKEAQELARVEAGNALLDRENTIKSIHADIETKLESGEIRHDQATQYYENAVKALPVPTVDGLDEVGVASFQKGLRRVELSGVSGVQVSADRARKVEFKGAIDKMLDSLGKQAGQPGADIDQVNAQIDALEQGRIAYGANWEQVKQAAKDKNWTNNAMQRAMNVHNDLTGLQQLEHDLTAEDGFYAGKLDTDKRNAILSSVINSKTRLENQLQHQSEMADVKAQRVLSDMERQNFSGIPPTPDMVSNWADQVRGTSAEAEFSQLLAQQTEIQKLLSLPMAEQKAAIEQMQSEIVSGGGDVKQYENIGKLKSIVANNEKELQDAPLVFLGKRTGLQPPPLDFTAALSGRPDEIATAFQSRMANLQTMQRQYGANVPLKPLLPQEVTGLTSMLKQAPPQQALGLFSALHKAINDADGYSAAMRQLAPDSPVTAMAGTLYGENRTYTSSRFGLESTVTASGSKAAEYILKGERLLNPGLDSKAANDTKLFMPKEADLRIEFDSIVGDAFAGHPEAANVAYQAARAAYAGMAAEKGITTPDIDLVSKAIDQVTGGVVDAFNSKVIPPYGMPADVFIDRVTAQFNEKAKAAGMNTDWGAINRFKIYSVGKNRYGFSNGTTPLPFTVDVEP